jgi:hypothetical protein
MLVADLKYSRYLREHKIRMMVLNNKILPPAYIFRELHWIKSVMYVEGEPGGFGGCLA